MLEKKKRQFNLKNYLISVLRRASYRTPMRSQALNAAKIGRNQYVCKECGPSKIYGRKEIKVDHIQAVRPVDQEWDWNLFIERLFCSSSGLQILCGTCHKKKTQEENKQRREFKKCQKLKSAQKK